MPLISIVDWNESFENAESRKYVNLPWFRCPTGNNSKGYRRLMRQGSTGLAALGLFQALCQAMGEISKDNRGKFVDSKGLAMDLEDISEITRVPMDLIEQLIPVLESVGWVTVESQEVTENLPPISQSSPSHLPPISHPSPEVVGLDKIRKEKIREDKSTPLPPKGEWQADEIQTQINSLFRRKESTPWSDKELRAYRKISFDPEDLEIITAYYLASIPRAEDIRRRDIVTLLNNWPGEVDRARAFIEPTQKEKDYANSW